MPFTIEEKEKTIHITSTAKKQTELFVETARALFSCIYDIDRIHGRDRVKIVVDAASPHALLHAWLQELLARKNIHKIAFGEFSVASIQKVSDLQYLLTGAAYGEQDDPPTHPELKKIKEIRNDSCACDEKDGIATCSYEVVLM